MGPDQARFAARTLARLYPLLQPKRFHRAVANLRDAFPAISDDAVRTMALRSYQHVAQLGVEVAFAPRLITHEGFARHLFFGDVAQGLASLVKGGPVILVTAHVGNWELVGYAISTLGFPMHAVYRPFDLKPLDTWVRETRERRGLNLVSKFGAVRALPPLLANGEPVGLVADQSGGDRGIFAPFFGRLTSTYKSIGILAMQTNATLVCGFARRMNTGDLAPDGRIVPQGSLAFAVEMVDTFGPDDWNPHPDRLFYITARYRRAIEMMVRKAPEQYFWMHRIWRSRPAHERLGKPFPPALRDKLLSLPWLTPAEVDALVDRSNRDARDLKRLQT
jgi:KDO2-lipid IV(A) lauroyltransferase